MALDVSKIRQQNQVSAGTTPANSAASGASNQPINMNTGTVDSNEQNQKVLDFINSAEYKNCPDDQKLELLKQQFPHLKDLNTEDLQKHLEAIKHIETSETQGSTEVENENTSELETLAERFAQQNNIKSATIDDVIAYINTLDDADRSEDAKKILEIYNSKTTETDNELNEIKIPEETSTTPAIDQETMRKITNEPNLDKKLRLAVENFLETHDPEYVKIENEEEKQQYLEEKVGVLIVYCNKQFDEKMAAKNSEVDETSSGSRLTNRIFESFKASVILTKSMAALQLLHNEGKSIEELLNVDTETFSQTTDKIEGMSIQAYYNALTRDNPNMSTKEKLSKLFEISLSGVNEDYNLKTQEDKMKFQERFVQSSICKFYGVKSWDELSETQKVNGEKILLNNLDTAIKNFDSSNSNSLREDIKNISEDGVAMYTTLVNQYREELANAPEEKRAEIQKNLNYATEMLSLQELCKQYKDDPDALREVLRQKLDNGEFQNEDAKLAVESMLAIDEFCDCDGKHLHPDGLNSDRLAGKALTTENFTEYLTNFAKSHPKHTQKYHDEVVEWIARAYYNSNTEVRENELAVIREVLLKQGFPNSQIDKMFQHFNVELRRAAVYAAQGEGREYVASMHRIRANNSDEYQRLADNLVKKASSRWVLGDNIPALEEVGAAIQDSQRDIDLFNSGLHEHQDPPTIEDLYNRIANSDKFSDTNKTNFTSSLISTANSDQDRVNYANLLSKINNSSILDGLAQGASSVKSPQYQSQYVQTVVTAAKSYPQETRTLVNSTLVSQTSPSVVNNAINTSYGANQSAPTVSTDYISNTPIQPSTIGSSVDNMPITEGNIKSTPTIDYEQFRQEVATNQTLANEKMKAIAMENVAEVKKKIDESIAEWELKQELKLTDEVISEMKQIAASEALEEYIEANPTQKEIIIQKLSTATSVGEIYDILLSALGSKVHQKFIENLASNGSLANVRAFINSKAGNTDVIKQILMKTSSKTLKSELINMLSSSDVLELLESNVITTLEDIDHEILFTYVSKNIYSMTQTNFANFLKYLPFDEREKLIQMRNEALGIVPKTEESEDVIEEETLAAAATQDAQTEQAGQNIFGVTNPQLGQNNPLQAKSNQNEQDPNTPIPETKFKAGETKKTLSDGREITNLGTTFAGISSNSANDDCFRVIDPKLEKKEKNKEGAPIGMNDEVLTPGSPEWLRKYNRQAPTTAFTMAALEELEEGPNLGSTRVKRGQPIKKKYNTNGFNIRG